MIKQTCISAASVAIAVLAIFAATMVGQSSTKNKPPSGTITGHVTLDDKPAAGVSVVANPCENSRYPNGAPAASGNTDGDGLYRLTGLPAGHYCVNAFAPAWVAQQRPGSYGTDLNIASGETVDDINLALKKGGVITGRVLDADGEPVISERVQATMYTDNNSRVVSKSEPTDDRGVYRIYGLTPGKYKVQVGEFDANGGTAMGSHRTHLATFYADEAGVTDPTRAKFVNVSTEDEATDIDIAVQDQRTYPVTGTVISEQTGQGVPGLKITCSIRDSNGRAIRQLTDYQYATDAKGGFSFPNLTAGHYIVRVSPTDGFNLYSDPVQFDLAESNVSGLIVKAKTSSSISGIVVLNTTNPDYIEKASKLSLSIQSFPPDRKVYSNVSAKVTSNGTFQAGGLMPGTGQITLYGSGPTAAFKIIRIERGGAEVKGTFPISDGEAISDIKVIVGVATGTVHGTMKIEGNSIPSEMYFRVQLTAINGGQRMSVSPELDARGQFIVRNLLPGQYVFQIITSPLAGRVQPKMSLADAKKTVEISDGQDVSITLTVVINPGLPNGEKP